MICSMNCLMTSSPTDNKETKSILIVEDNEIDSSQIAKIHQEDKLDVTIAATGKEALELVKNEEFDCIILDYTLAGYFGYGSDSRSKQGEKEIDTCDCLFCQRF